ncbi:4102_t:CDS:1, partial [Acaulospora morrowiae]
KILAHRFMGEINVSTQRPVTVIVVHIYLFIQPTRMVSTLRNRLNLVASRILTIVTPTAPIHVSHAANNNWQYT